jgi:hypothetical protein
VEQVEREQAHQEQDQEQVHQELAELENSPQQYLQRRLRKYRLKELSVNEFIFAGCVFSWQARISPPPCSKKYIL